MFRPSIPILKFIMVVEFIFSCQTLWAMACRDIYFSKGNISKFDSTYINNAIESGYKKVDLNVETFNIGGEKTKIQFLALSGVDEPKFGSPKERGTVQLRFKAKDVKHAVSLFGKIINIYQREPSVVRDNWNLDVFSDGILNRELIRNRTIEIHDSVGEYAVFNNGVLAETSKWDTPVGNLYSGEHNINAAIEPGWAINLKKPGYKDLGVTEEDMVVTVLTHPGRNESVNSERLFRALFNYGISGR